MTNMTFPHAIATCLRNYATFQGRASRPEFWWFFLFQLALSFVVSMLSPSLSALASLALALPALAVGARRLHDIGRSGWWQLLSLTLIGIVLLLFWFAQPGQPTSGEIAVD